MAAFSMFAGDKARKKKEYERKLVEVTAWLRTACEQREKAKDEIRQIEYDMKIKLAEYESCTSPALKKQLYHELQIEEEKLTGTENRLKVQNTTIRTFERFKGKTQELLYLLDRPGVEGDIPALIGELEAAYPDLVEIAGWGGDLVGVGLGGFVDTPVSPDADLFDELHKEAFGQGSSSGRISDSQDGWDELGLPDVSDELAQMQRELDEEKKGRRTARDEG